MERRKAVDNLGDIVGELWQFLEYFPSAVYVAEAPSGTIRLHNRRAAEFWGREPSSADVEERLYASLRLFRPDGSRLQYAQTPMAAALRSGSAQDDELLIERADGARAIVRVSAVALRDSGGKIVGAMNVLQVIGGREMREREQIEGDAARLSAIVASADDAIVSKSLDGTIMTWNRAAERMFGYSAAEAIGRPITLIIPPERVDEEAGILARLKAGHSIAHFETVRVAKDGQRIPISLTISPIRDRERPDHRRLQGRA